MVVPAASVPAEGAARPGGGEGGVVRPHWEPLDVLSPGAGNVDAPARRDPSESSAGKPGSVVVREVRRATREPSSAGAVAGLAAAAGPGGMDEVASRASVNDREQLSRGAQRGRGAGLFGLGRRFGLGRGGPDRSASAREDEGADRARSPVRRGGGPTTPPDARRVSARGHAQTGSGVVRQEGPERSLAAESGTLPPHASHDLEEAPGDVELEPPVVEGHRPDTESAAVTATASWPGDRTTVEEDMRAVLAYLSEPDVPAIVRTERVAEALGLSVARVERALDRVSEGSEHLGRIRNGAYMLRRPKKG